MNQNQRIIYVYVYNEERQVLYMSPQLTQALYPVYCEAKLYNVYILSVYTVHRVANVILNYIKSVNVASN